MYCLVQTADTLKACPAPFDAGYQEFDPDKALPVSVLNTEHKWMRVQDVKSMSWEQHVAIWKVCLLAQAIATLCHDSASCRGCSYLGCWVLGFLGCCSGLPGCIRFGLLDLSSRSCCQYLIAIRGSFHPCQYACASPAPACTAAGPVVHSRCIALMLLWCRATAPTTWHSKQITAQHGVNSVAQHSMV